MDEYNNTEFSVTENHKRKELEQKSAIMEKIISIIELKEYSLQHGFNESEQVKFILKKLMNHIETEQEFDKNQFLTMISHELKTPLVPIKAYSEMLEEGKFGDISDKQRKKIKTISENARELIQLVSNMNEYQKFSLHKVKLQKRQNDIKKIIHDAHMFFSSEFDSKGMKINSTFSKPLFIECDERYVQQLLTNLLQVSLYAIPQKHGKIIVNVFDKENEVEISVYNNGETISLNDLNKIFSDFYKVDTTSIRSNGGIGLSLALCKKIVEAHEGKILATTDNKGMKITFTIPK